MIILINSKNNIYRKFKLLLRSLIILKLVETFVITIFGGRVTKLIVQFKSS